MPQQRIIAKKYFIDITLIEIDQLLISAIHEERLIALFMLVYKFERASGEEQEAIYIFYIDHKQYVNNWDLVDSSADKIVGAFLYDKPKDILSTLAKPQNLWDRRIAIIATYWFIKEGEYKETFTIAALLLHDTEDLIHKAVGWMLREVGKRCSRETEEVFLHKYYKIMPRTMLRYAIEHFSYEKRKAYLLGKI